MRTFLPRLHLLLYGCLFGIAGLGLFYFSVIYYILTLILGASASLATGALLMSGWLVFIGSLLVLFDLFLLLPYKRRFAQQAVHPVSSRAVTVALTAYNDEQSVAAAVEDFKRHLQVQRVIVVDNASMDATAALASEAGAIVVNEPVPGYGSCAYRCMQEAVSYQDTELVVICESDMTFRAADIDKLLAYSDHAEIINGTRIVEQLRAYDTQLTTFMYFGNFFMGKLLEAKHIGKGTFSDVGTTYKLCRRDALTRLLPHLDPRVNLEFNAHFMDRALDRGIAMLECPITFHKRVGQSKGGNVSNLRALSVGCRMLVGLIFSWNWVRAR